MTSWEASLKDHLSPDKLLAVRDLVETQQLKRRKAETLILWWGVPIVVAVGLLLWIFGPSDPGDKKDLVDGLIALVLAVWALLVPQLPDLDYSKIETAAGKKIHRTIFYQMKKEIKTGHSDLDRRVALIAAALLFVNIIMHIGVKNARLSQQSAQADPISAFTP